MSLLTKGVHSVVKGAGAAGGATIANNIFGKSGKQQGKEQRDYMDSAYGDLNQWEQAGAGQQGAATASETNASAERMAKQANETQKETNTETNKTQDKMNDDKLKQQQPVVDAQVKQIESQTANNTVDTYNKQHNKSRPAQVADDIVNTATTAFNNSPVGRNMDTIKDKGKQTKNWLSDKWDKVKGVGNTASQQIHKKSHKATKKKQQEKPVTKDNYKPYN